jgi:hypothetical protein
LGYWPSAAWHMYRKCRAAWHCVGRFGKPKYCGARILILKFLRFSFDFLVGVINWRVKLESNLVSGWNPVESTRHIPASSAAEHKVVKFSVTVKHLRSCEAQELETKIEVLSTQQTSEPA